MRFRSITNQAIIADVTGTLTPSTTRQPLQLSRVLTQRTYLSLSGVAARVGTAALVTVSVQLCSTVATDRYSRNQTSLRPFSP